MSAARRNRETFPDWVLDEAHEIIMVDITPELLHERLSQGKVYDRGKASQALKGHFQAAEELGAVVHEVRGTDVVAEIVRFAGEKQISQVVLGAGRPSRWEEIRSGSLIDRLLRRTDNLDILIVSERRKD